MPVPNTYFNVVFPEAATYRSAACNSIGYADSGAVTGVVTGRRLHQIHNSCRIADADRDATADTSADA